MRIDFQLDDDGDLKLGTQQVNAEGYLLYYRQPTGEDQKPYLTTEPGVGTVPVRDFSLVLEEASELQLIRTRLMTENPDWSLYKTVGADLTELIGRRNNPQTAALGENLIMRALTYDNAFEKERVSVEAIPVSQAKILFVLTLKKKTTQNRYGISFDLQLGITNIYELKG